MSITLSQAIERFFRAAQARRLRINSVADYSVTFRKFQAFVNDEEILTRLDKLQKFAQ